MTDGGGSPHNVEEIADLLRVLGHAVRLRIIMSLVSGERSVGEIEEVTGIQQPGLSQQLSILRKAELVSTRRKSKQIFYATNQDRLGTICAAMGWMHLVTDDSSSAPKNAELERKRKLGSAAQFARIA